MNDDMHTVESPESFDSEEFVSEWRDKYLAARRHCGKWKRETKKDYDYYAGRQWSENEKAALETAGKAAVVMNRIKPRVSAVVGMEISNRQELRYVPREVNDEALISLVNKASEWTRDQAETEDHETEQFQDMVIGGMGWSQTLMDYEENFDGIATTVRNSPLNYDWDPDARQANLADMEFYFYSEDVTRDQFKAMGFDIAKARSGALGVADLWENMDETPHDAEQAKFYPTEVPMGGPGGDDDRYKRGKKYRLVRLEYCTRVKVWRVMMPDGQMRILDPENADAVAAEMLATTGIMTVFQEFDGKDMPVGFQTVPEGNILVLPYVEQMQKRYRRAYFSGDNLLEDEESPCPYEFSDQCMTGWRDEVTGYFIGMVRGLRDPQEWSNKFLSQAIYIYTVNPKGGIIAKKRAFTNPNEVEEKYASPDAVLWANDDVNFQTDIMERKPGQYPSDLDKLTAFAIESLPALDGLTPETMGQVARDQPGVLENMRKQASMTVLAPLFNSKRRYHKRQGRILLHFISRYFTDAQLERIVGGPIPPEVLQALRDLDVRNYDVIVDDAPSSPNAKEYTMNVLMEILRQAPTAAAALMPLMVKNTPLDIETQQEIVQALAPMADPMNTPQGQAIQKQMQDMAAKLQKLETRERLDMFKIASKTAVDQARLSQQDEQADDELAMKLRELELKRDELDQEYRLALMEMQNNLRIAKEQPTNNGASGD